MKKWNYYDATGNWLGVCDGENAEEALKNAQAKHQDAQSVQERGETSSHERN